MNNIITLLFISMFLTTAVMAAEKPVCDALLNDKSLYNDWASYQYLQNGKEGWVFRTSSDFKTKFKLNNTTKLSFKTLNTILNKQGINLVLAPIPTRGMVHPNKIRDTDFDVSTAQKNYQSLIQIWKDLGLTVPQIDDFSSLPNHYFYKRDHHWSPNGAQDMAQRIAKEIKNLPVYATLPKTKYETHTQGLIKHLGTFERLINKVCPHPITSENIQKFVTTEKNAENNFLSDDGGAAEIVLLGTSNSTQSASHANFDGFLRENIGANVENSSISGGGFDTAILKFFTNLAQQNSDKKPKIIIWEFPVYQKFDSAGFFRQLIPTVKGRCPGTAILSKTIEINTPFISVFDDLSAQNIQAQNYYFSLQFSDFQKRKFRMITKYQTGETDYFDVKRDKFYTPDETFFLKASEKQTGRLKSLSLQLPKDVKRTISVDICPF